MTSRKYPGGEYFVIAMAHLNGIFIMTVAALGKLYTIDRLVNWGVNISQACSLCSTGLESISHLFFECAFSAYIWSRILLWQRIRRQILGWQEELSWMNADIKGKSASASIFKMAVVGCVYHIWHKRDMRIFQNKKEMLRRF